MFRAGSERPIGQAPLLSLAGGLEHGSVEGFARRLSGPYRALEGRIVALAGVQRRGEERLALPTGSLDPTGQYQRMPVHDEAVLDPKVEMSDPHLLVNERDELLDLR